MKTKTKSRSLTAIRKRRGWVRDDIVRKNKRRRFAEGAILRWKRFAQGANGRSKQRPYEGAWAQPFPASG